MATRLVRSGDESALRAAWWLFPVVAVVLLASFLGAPGAIGEKAHAALHGLCAQIPSHSLTLGGKRLPLDSRMTGMYAGAFVTSLCLIAMGRLRATRFAPAKVWPFLAGPVLVLAVDGSNSLARDLGLRTLYMPSNVLRLSTGLLTGVTLGVAVCFLLAGTLWRRGEPGLAVVGGIRDWAILVLAQAVLAVLLLSGNGGLYAPVAILLVVAAIWLVGALLVSIGLIVLERDRRYQRLGDLAPVATAGLLGAVAVMAAAAAGRMLLESVVGPSPLT